MTPREDRVHERIIAGPQAFRWPASIEPEPKRTRTEASPLRVLLVVNSLCIGGAEKQVVSLFNGMNSGLYDVSLICLKENLALLKQIDPARLPRLIKALGVRRGIEWQAVRQLAEHVDRYRIDVVVCTNMYALLYAWLAQRLCQRKDRLRLVEVFHTTEVGSLKERLSMLLYRQLLRATDLLIYVCHGQAIHWRRQGLRARQDMVIYNGIDLTRFARSWPDDERAGLRVAHGMGAADYVVGLCAVMRPEKAHGDLLVALAALRREGLNVHCLLIGDGPERSQIERQIGVLGLTGNVHITGLIEDVRPLVAICDVMVLASHAVETFSIAALEAMALGKPMVMTNIGGAPEQVTHGENGLLYRAGDAHALANHLRSLADEPRRKALGLRAASRVHRAFDVARMVRSYECALTALASGQAVRSDERQGSPQPPLGVR